MPRVCLRKHAKLLKAADFNFVFDKAVRSSDRYFTVLARPNNNTRSSNNGVTNNGFTSRMGTAFSKKRVKLAVSRNRLKRIARESFRLLNSGQSKYSLDFVVLAGPHCTRATNQQLFHSLETHWQQLIKKCIKL